jgi:hypothetical protein
MLCATEGLEGCPASKALQAAGQTAGLSFTFQGLQMDIGSCLCLTHISQGELIMLLNAVHSLHWYSGSPPIYNDATPSQQLGEASLAGARTR